MAEYSIPAIMKIKQELVLAQAKCVRLIAEEGEKKLKEFIMNNWYNAYSPGSYERTMDFYQSAKSTYTHDTAIIKEDSGAFSSSPNPGGWGQHASMDGTPFTGEAILNVLENGTNGGISPRNGDSAEALKATEAYIRPYAEKIVRETFGSAGRVV